MHHLKGDEVFAQKVLFLRYISRVIAGGSVKPTEHAAETETTGIIWLPPAGTTGLTHRRPYTAISRKVVGKKMCTRQSRKVKWDMNNTLSLKTVAVEPTLVLANICPWPLVPFFQIFLKNSELKSTQNAFRDYRVHFFR